MFISVNEVFRWSSLFSDTSTLLQTNHIHARSRLLSQEQLLLGIVPEDTVLDNVSIKLVSNIIIEC